MDGATIMQWLRTDDDAAIEELWRRADAVRRHRVGNAVHLRGLIEVSNRCVRRCAYCGIAATNTAVERYCMDDAEILACAHKAAGFGYGTVVLQAGETPELDCARVEQLVRRIKTETPLAVTLSLGEQDEATLQRWRDAGADRYLLRFETANPTLFARIHPRAPGAPDRLALLRLIKSLGYETGGGAMIGIPGQTWDDLVRDIQTFAALRLDMIGVGPYLPHPATPMGNDPQAWMAPPEQQVPAAEQLVYRVIALARLVRPDANIPSTTALATVNLDTGRELGLQRGANVLMPNLTPVRYRALYAIYPGKACLDETGEQCHACMRGRIARIDRNVGTGRGDSPGYGSAQAAST